MTHSFQDDAVATWVPQDWSAFAGFAVWVYGQNTGTGLFVDVLDNRNPGSTTNDTERWTVSFVDDFAGWRLLEWTWDQFARMNIGDGAPDDGLNLTEVHGWAFGALTTAGPVDRDVSVDATPAPGFTVSGDDRVRVLQIEPDVTVEATGLTVTHGAGSGRGGGISTSAT